MAWSSDRAVAVCVGEVFGYWTVTGSAVCNRFGIAYVPCRCQCGTERPVRRRNLLNGESQSCGCRLASWNAATKTTHGHTRNGQESRDYSAWKRAKQRHGYQEDFVTWLAEQAA